MQCSFERDITRLTFDKLMPNETWAQPIRAIRKVVLLNAH